MKTNQEVNLLTGQITLLRRALARAQKHLLARDQELQRARLKNQEQLRSVELALALRQVKERGHADG